MRKPADLGVAVQGARKPWLGYGDLRLEAVIFLLVAVSFAAVLGKSALTRQTLVLSSQSGRFATYSYSDAENGGGSVVSLDPRKPLSWSCDIRPGAAYPYCGYGLQLDVGRQTEGLDFSHFQTIVLRFSYQGQGDRLRLVVKASPEAAVQAKLRGEPMPLAMDIPVVRGRNEVRLPLNQLSPEEWWVASHGLSAAEAAPNLEAVRSVAVTTSGAKVGHLAISVDDLTFEGSYLSTEQFYLVILGVWLVLSAGFLVWRFLHLRGNYEARRRRQAEEARRLAEAHASA
ncbi:MAG: hypothetical protein JF615_16555, partial [Asticcacaulis sp.]|nr:hypothetical protein [Asticcacaulis sp.]